MKLLTFKSNGFTVVVNPLHIVMMQERHDSTVVAGKWATRIFVLAGRPGMADQQLDVSEVFEDAVRQWQDALADVLKPEAVYR